MPTAIRGPILTNRRITYYIRRGFYGTARRNALLTEESKPKRQRKVKKLDLMQQALDLLG